MAFEALESIRDRTSNTAQGHEFVGIIEAVGSDVRTHRVGDKVVSVFAAVWFGSCVLKPADFRADS